MPDFRLDPGEVEVLTRFLVEQNGDGAAGLDVRRPVAVRHAEGRRSSCGTDGAASVATSSATTADGSVPAWTAWPSDFGPSTFGR